VLLTRDPIGPALFIHPARILTRAPVAFMYTWPISIGGSLLCTGRQLFSLQWQLDGSGSKCQRGEERSVRVERGETHGNKSQRGEEQVSEWRNAWQAPLGSPDLVEAIIDGRYTLGNNVRHIKSWGWQVEASSTPDEVALSSCNVYCCKLSQKSGYRLEALMENLKRTAQALCYSHAFCPAACIKILRALKTEGTARLHSTRGEDANQEEKKLSGLSAFVLHA
jgi:hypothetical protein